MMFNWMLRNQRVNHESGPAYGMTPEFELYTAVVTASLNEKFYESNDERMLRIIDLVGKVSPEFVAQLAVYTRTQMHLRSIPLLLVVELARIHNGDDLVARTIDKVVLRADEITELLACYQLRNPSGHPTKMLSHLSRQVQNGLQRAFNRFDEYQFAKYNRQNTTVKLRDALFLVHPRPKDENQQRIFDKIASDSLDVPYTWETEFSALGQQHFSSDQEKALAFTGKWEELVESGRLGYMALMRNLRNLLQSGVNTHTMQTVCQRLSDPVQVASSKQFPFRYLAAYREARTVDSIETQAVLTALEAAVKYSASNISGFDTDTRVLLACDVSGSMRWPISKNSVIEHYDIGLMLAMLLRHRCHQVVTGIFGDDWMTVNMPQGDILPAVDSLRSLGNKVGFSTNGYKVIDWLIEQRMVVDKVMMFTDMQMWDSTDSGSTLAQSWQQYKQMAPQARLYLFDLVGYGQAPLQLIDNDVCLIAGWSDRIFDILHAIENGSTAIEQIGQIQV